MLDKLKNLLTNNKKFLRPMAFKSGEYEEVSLSVADIKSALYSSDISELLQLYATLIQRDLTLSSALNHRKQQLSGIPYKIHDEANEKTWQALLPHLKIPTLIGRLSVAIEYGLSITDITWSEVTADDGKTYFLPTGFHTIAPLNIGHDTQIKTGINDALYLTSADGNKNTLSSYHPAKLLIHYHPSDDTHINRYSPVYKAAWLVALKHHAMARNMQYFDALGVPPVVIKVDTYDEDELKAVFEQGKNLRSNATGIFAKETDIEVLKGSVTKAQFLEFIQYVDEQIQLAINGNTLSSTHAESGSRAQSEVHERRLFEKRDFDARLIEESINKLVGMIAAINFPKSNARFSFNLDPKQDLLNLSEIHKNLSDAGFHIPEEHMAEVYGIEGISIKPQPHSTQQSNSLTWALSQRERAQLVDPLATLGKRAGMRVLNPNEAQKPDNDLPDLNPVETLIKTRINSLLSESDSYEEMLDNLAKLYIDMPTEELERHLSDHLMNHQLLANAEINQENPEG